MLSAEAEEGKGDQEMKVRSAEVMSYGLQITHFLTSHITHHLTPNPQPPTDETYFVS